MPYFMPIFLTLTERDWTDPKGNKQVRKGVFSKDGKFLTEHADFFTNLTTKPLSVIAKKTNPDFKKSVTELRTKDPAAAEALNPTDNSSQEYKDLDALKKGLENKITEIQKSLDIEFDPNKQDSSNYDGRIARLTIAKQIYGNDLKAFHTKEMNKLEAWFAAHNGDIAALYDNVNLETLKQTWKDKLQKQHEAEQKAFNDTLTAAITKQLEYSTQYDLKKLNRELIENQHKKYKYEYHAHEVDPTIIIAGKLEDNGIERQFTLHNDLLANPYGNGKPMRVEGNKIIMDTGSEYDSGYSVNRADIGKLIDRPHGALHGILPNGWVRPTDTLQERLDYGAKAMVRKQLAERGVTIDKCKIKLTANARDVETGKRLDSNTDRGYELCEQRLQKMWKGAIKAGYLKDHISGYKPTRKDLNWMRETQRKMKYDKVQNKRLGEILCNSPDIPEFTPAEIDKLNTITDTVEFSQIKNAEELKELLDKEFPNKIQDKAGWAKHINIREHEVADIRTSHIINPVLRDALKDATINGKPLTPAQQMAINRISLANPDIKTVDQVIDQLNKGIDGNGIPGLPENWVNKLEYPTVTGDSFFERSEKRINNFLRSGNINKQTFKDYLPKVFTVSSLKKGQLNAADRAYNTFTKAGLTTAMERTDNKLTVLATEIQKKEANPEVLSYYCQEFSDAVDAQLASFEILEQKMNDEFPKEQSKWDESQILAVQRYVRAR